MAHDPNAHHRHSLRLPGYDYAQDGAYFVTLCTQGRECLFGEVAPSGEMVLNEAGRMVERWWNELGARFPHVIPDAFVVMPNHFHGIVLVVPRDGGAHGNRGAHAGAPLHDDDAHVVGADLCVGPVTDVGSVTKGAHAGAPLRNDGEPAGAHAGHCS